MGIFSRRRWATRSAQQCNMYGTLPCMCSRIYFGFFTNTTAYQLGRYNLHLFSLKSSTDNLDWLSSWAGPRSFADSRCSCAKIQTPNWRENLNGTRTRPRTSGTWSATRTRPRPPSRSPRATGEIKLRYFFPKNLNSGKLRQPILADLLWPIL